MFCHDFPLRLAGDQVAGRGEAAVDLVQDELADLLAVIKQQVAAQDQIEIPVDALRGAAQALVQQVVGGEVDPFFEAVDYPE